MTPSRRLAGLFLVALLGVIAVVGIVAHAVGGVAGLIGWLALATAALTAGAARLRHAVAGPAPAQHCTCCDGDHTAPVRIV